MIIGITGGPGSGKSTVLRYFRDSGYAVASADSFVHGLLKADEKVKGRIRECFGRSFFNADGTVNRRKLAAAVFSSRSRRIKLESIVHPPVIEALAEIISIAREKKRGLAVEIPLLYEKKLRSMVDRAVVVYSGEAMMKNRLMKKFRITEKEALGRIRAQLPIDRKKKLADYVILNDNNGREGRAFLRKQVREILCDRPGLHDGRKAR